MHLSIDLAPHVALGWIVLIAVVAGMLCGYALWGRAPGAIASVVAFAIACIVLANPLIVRERRAPLPDIVALVVDDSASMALDHRRADADRAAAAMARQIAADRTLEIRRAEVTSPLDEDSGTRLMSAATSALAAAPPERVAGTIAVTDGEVHDADTASAATLHAPFHAL